MSNIPEDIRKQIEEKYPEVEKLAYGLMHVDTDYVNKRAIAEYGYSLASSEIESLRKEVERLKGLIRAAYNAGKEYGIADMREYHGGSENEKPSLEKFLKQNQL